MCRPSCCNNGGQGAGIAAVALIMLAALIAARIVRIADRIIHVVLDVIRLAALTTGLVLVLAAVAWAAIVITRWQLRRAALAAAQPRMVAIRFPADQPIGPAGCLACGGTGMVLRAITGSGYQPQDCPVCEPARRVG